LNVVESASGAVSMLPSIRFPKPLAKPAVDVSDHYTLTYVWETSSPAHNPSDCFDATSTAPGHHLTARVCR
jgi:hypothetical protein